MGRQGWKELCWQLFGLKGRKREKKQNKKTPNKKTNFLLDSAARAKERKGEWGWCCKNSLSRRCPAGLARPPPAPGGRSHEHPRRGVRKAGGAVPGLQAELKVSSRGGRKLQALSPPRLTFWGAAVGRGGGGDDKKRPPRPGGAPGRAHHPGLRPQLACRAVSETVRRAPPPRAGRSHVPASSPRVPATPQPQYLYSTAEEGARVSRQLLHIEVHDVHPGRQPGGAAG